MFFLVFGPDTFRSRKRLAALREQFALKRDTTGLNATVFRARDAEIAEVAESLYASPFLADRKLLILEGFLQASVADQEKIKEMLDRKPETTNVIFYEDVGSEDLAKSPLLPLMRTQKFTEECMQMSGAQLEGFAVEECKAAGVTLAPRQARALVGVVGTDTWLLHEEIAKLCAYARACGATDAAATVTDEMLSTLIPGAREESVFELVDACVEGRPGAAVMLERALDGGMAEMQLLAMLLKQYRTMIGVGDLVQRGERDKNAVARRMGIHAFPASKAMASVRQHSPAELHKQYDALLEIERQIKTSGGKANALLGVWLARRAVNAS